MTAPEAMMLVTPSQEGERRELFSRSIWRMGYEVLRLKSLLALMLCPAFSLLGQGSFTKQGGEYVVLGDLPGDQIHPCIAAGINRGYLVWQDGGTTLGGASIRLKRLQGLQPDGFGHYNVSTTETSRNEFPRVALMVDGSAVVVWQRVGPSGSDICARFIDPTGVFSTKEIILNTHQSGDQGRPAVAALPGGGVVVVWSSYGQDGSMNGVFGRVFDAVGNAMTGEFQVNAFEAYNQKEPSVASLSNGGFIVTWVSEQQRFAGSVDVYSRVFGPMAEPQGGEIRLNTGNEMAMAPVVSGNESGGFVAAWMQRDADASSNGWDIYYGTFDAAGASVHPAMRLNINQYGDQFSPRISPTGVEHMIVWTSLGQDGSQEGVYGRFVGSDGHVPGDEFLVNTSTINKQIHPVVGADGAGRLLVVWTSFSKGSGSDLASFNLHAQAYDAVRPIPPPNPPLVTSTASGTLTIAWAPVSGFNVASYEVHVEGLASLFVTHGNHVVIPDLVPGQTYSASLGFVLADGRRSPVSASVTHATWDEDANQDGIPDDWQAAHFGPVPKGGAWPSAEDDFDGDGASNQAEFRAGTDPRDPTSVLKSQVETSSGHLRFQWNTRPGFLYQVQISTNLVDWSDYGLPRFAAGQGDMVPIGVERSAAYYRVILAR